MPPLLHGVGRRRVEQRDAAQDLHVRDLALGRDRALQDHDALHPRLLRDVGIDGGDVLELLRLLDLSAHAHRLDRGWGSVRQPTHDAADDAARHAALDTAPPALAAPPSTPMSMLSSGVISSGTSTGATNLFSRIGLGMTLGALAGRAAG